MVLILANKIITIFMRITQAENDMNINDHDFGSDFSKTTKHYKASFYRNIDRNPVTAMRAGQIVF